MASSTSSSSVTTVPTPTTTSPNSNSTTTATILADTSNGAATAVSSVAPQSVTVASVADGAGTATAGNSTTTTITSSPSASDATAGGMANLIVNYLPHSVTDAVLLELFSPFGVVEHVKVVLDRTTGQSAGYGFVRFTDAESARKAQEAMSGVRMQNKVLKVSYARPSSHDIKHANLYIANLGPHVTKEQLLSLFAPFGAIIDARILVDLKTNTSRGVGFVRFDKRSEADLAIKTLNGKVLPNGGTGQLVVKFADRDNHMPNKMRGGSAGTGGERGYPNEPYGSQYNVAPSGHNHYPHPTTPYAGQSLMHHQHMGMAPPSHQPYGLYISGLPEHADENLLFRLFGPFGTVVQVKIVRHPNGPCKGYGFVNMLSYQDAMRAIMYMNGYQITPDRLLHVAFKK